MISVTSPPPEPDLSEHVLKTDVNTLVIPAGGMAAVLGSPSLGLSNRVAVWLLDAAVIEDVGGTFAFPGFWNTCHADIYWTNAGINAGTARIRFDLLNGQVVENNATPDPSSFTGSTLDAIAPAQNIVARSRVATDFSIPATKVMAYEIVRLAADAVDTLANDIGIINLTFTRTS